MKTQINSRAATWQAGAVILFLATASVSLFGLLSADAQSTDPVYVCSEGTLVNTNQCSIPNPDVFDPGVFMQGAEEVPPVPPACPSGWVSDTSGGFLRCFQNMTTAAEVTTALDAGADCSQVLTAPNGAPKGYCEIDPLPGIDGTAGTDSTCNGVVTTEPASSCGEYVAIPPTIVDAVPSWCPLGWTPNSGPGYLKCYLVPQTDDEADDAVAAGGDCTNLITHATQPPKGFCEIDPILDPPSVSPTPNPTPELSVTIEPTATPEPATTPALAATPEPTATATATATATEATGAAPQVSVVAIGTPLPPIAPSFAFVSPSTDSVPEIFGGVAPISAPADRASNGGGLQLDSSPAPSYAIVGGSAGYSTGPS